ncbi:restriction endonuclease subunit S [Desulfovibrio piger]|uniref:restriction endonuclease subunit S n=3 Tax=Desulfovibrio piger TaxID=901 RepID=UPI003AB12F0A
MSRQFPSGTIVMAIAANVGDVAILDFDACFPDSVIGFTNLININKLFFYYTLITLKQVFIEKSTISTQLNLNIEIVNEVKIPYPPLPEQERIAAYLDKKCARIDALLEEKQALLDKLAEYKKSLIFECVTGKREVPSCWNR